MHGGFFYGLKMKDNRAYSVLNIKKVDEDQRIIRGMATTPEADRVGDTVDPFGVEFRNPTPLLMMHNHDLPVGSVTFGKPTKDGVPFEARIPKIENPSGLKARVDEAWESVKSGIITAVSIGFRALEWSVNEKTGGLNFLKSEIMELSLVSVPANRSATINSIKSFDAELRQAALGEKAEDAKEKTVSGVTEKKSQTVKLTPKKENKMNLQDQIKQFQNERAAKVAQMEELMEKSVEAGESLAEDQAETYDTLEGEVKKIDEHLKRMESLQKTKMSTAKAVDDKPTEKAAVESRMTSPVRVKQTLEKGIGFARLAKCKALSRLNNVPAYEVASSLYGQDNEVHHVLKSAVSAGTTLQSTWAAPLVGDESSIFADFIEYLRPMTILGKFGTNGIPSLRRVPFRTRLVGQTSGGAGYWVGEGAAKPVTKFDFNDTTLEPLKVANIAVITMELLRDSSPSAEAIVRDQLAAALRERLDIDFIDPAKVAVSNISPASITNGVSAITSVGPTADDIRCDLQALFGAFIAANNAPTNGVFIMSSVTALALSLMRNPLGQAEFSGITMNGGMLFGLPVIVSEYVPTDTAGGYVFLVNASDVYLGDDGGISVDMSDQASLQMLDSGAGGAGAPTNNSATPTPTTLVSLWQTNSVGFRAERTINYAKRRASAVAVLDGVNWGSCAT